MQYDKPRIERKIELEGKLTGQHHGARGSGVIQYETPVVIDWIT